MEKLRIAHIVSTFPPYKGGIGNVCRKLVGALSDRGLAVEVIIPKKSNNVKVESFPFPVHYWKSWLTIGNASFLPQFLWRVRCYDIVHIHYPFIGCEMVFLAKLLKPKMRIIVSYHMDLVGSGVMKIIFQLYQFLVLPIIARLAETIIFSSWDYGNSSKMAEWIKQHPKRSQECGYGVDTALFRPQVGKAVESGASLHVLFVAALDKAHYFKGLKNLLLAIQRTADTRLIIVGDGNRRDEYENMIKSLGIENRVVLLGRLSDQKLALQYRQADVLVLPSTDRSEAFGLVILEAFASGIPVIASRLPGVSMLINENGDGLLVAPGDVNGLVTALNYMLVHPEERKAMGLVARQKVLAKYQWGVIARSIEAIYFHRVIVGM